jgi:hypothetical protein
MRSRMHAAQVTAYRDHRSGKIFCSQQDFRSATHDDASQRPRGVQARMAWLVRAA